MWPSRYVDQLLASSHLHAHMIHSTMTTCLDIYRKAGQYQKVVDLFYSMKPTYNIQPEYQHYGVLVYALVGTGQYDKLQSVVDNMKENNIIPEVAFINSCMDSLLKAGEPQLALDIKQYVHTVFPTTISITDLHLSMLIHTALADGK